MTAYIIVDIDVHNPDEYRKYLALVTPTVLACGGRYLIRGAESEVVSGDWQPKRVVLMEFPNLEVARHWVHCEEHAHIHAMRNQNAKANMVILEGSVDFTG